MLEKSGVFQVVIGDRPLSVRTAGYTGRRRNEKKYSDEKGNCHLYRCHQRFLLPPADEAGVVYELPEKLGRFEFDTLA